MFLLQYLSHSSFLITCGQTKLVFDPWLDGPAYFKQWYLWPPPAEGALDIKADAILISHGHEDHLHPNSLRSMHKAAQVFVPYQWREGLSSFLNHLGFECVTEAVTFRAYQVGNVKITYLSYSLESVVVLEYAGEVLVNINDALNSNHENASAFLLKELRRRWPKIDYLLSGWSGAGYFPNQIRYSGKVDVEIGKLREQYFANNFCRFTQVLEPKYSLPFCPGFVLLKPENQWINHVKFPRTEVEEYYRAHFDKDTSIQFLLPFPGDLISKGVLEKKSKLHTLNEEEQYALAYRTYHLELADLAVVRKVEVKELDRLVAELNHWMNYNKQLYDLEIIADVVFSIKLEDLVDDAYLNIHCDKMGTLVALKSATPLARRQLLITTTAEKLLYALGKVWGGDVLTIGYGLVIEVYDQLSLEKNLDIVCVRLITRYPMARKDLLKYPLRALFFYSANPRLTSLWLKQKIRLKPFVNKYPFNERDHWLSYSKCDLCAVCKMPEIDLRPYQKDPIH
jgi:hypothetical protein